MSKTIDALFKVCKSEKSLGIEEVYISMKNDKRIHIRNVYDTRHIVTRIVKCHKQTPTSARL